MLAVPSSSHDFDGSLSAVATLSQELHTVRLLWPHVPGRDTAGETAGLVTTFVVETDIGTTSCRTLIVPQAPPCKAHALTDGGKDALLTKMLDLAPGPGGQAASRSPAWSARRWPWPTICSTSCKRRWLLRDVLLPGGPGTSDSRLFGGRELEFVLHPPAFSGACSHGSTCGKPVVSLLDKDAGNQKPSAA